MSRLRTDNLVAVLRFAQIEKKLQPLIPLMLRLLEELGAEASFPELLTRTLLRADSEGDSDEYQECISFLSKAAVQRLLSLEDERLTRLIVLATFRESVARAQPFFITDIWGWEGGWLDRTRAVGERLQRLFAALHKLYRKKQSFADVTRTLATSVDPSESTAEAERTSAISLQQIAHQAAERLESPITMTGNFFRLRSSAATFFFGPLAPLVKARAVRQVQVELLRLEQSWRDGLLEKRVIDAFNDEFGDEHDLRADHRTSLRRYIESNLDLLRKWVEDELAAARAEPGSNDELLSEVHTAVSHLSNPSEVARYEIGSLQWLEARVRSFIEDSGRGVSTEPTLALFGEIPTGELLFARNSSSESLKLPWPEWLNFDPSAERCWVSQIKGRLSWRDLLQDGIAAVALGRQHTPSQVIAALIDCGEFEAAAQTAAFAEFNTPETKDLIARAGELAERRTATEEKCFDLDRRLRDHSRVSTLSVESRNEIRNLENLVLEAFAELEQGNVEEASSRAHSAQEAVMAFVAQTEAIEHQRRERLDFKRKWLKSAGVSVKEDTTLEEADALSQRILQSVQGRRAYLLRLRDLDSPGVPEILRVAIDGFIRAADWPERWPDEARGRDLEDHVEFLIALTQDWWSLLRRIDPEDVTYRKILSLADILAKKVPVELSAIASGNSEGAPLLDLLITQRTSTPSEFYATLAESGLIPLGEPADKSPAVTRSPLASESPPRSGIEVEGIDNALSSSQALSRIERALSQIDDQGTGTGKTVQEAYLAFGEARYADAKSKAALAWRFARGIGAEQDTPALAAIFGWASWESGSPAYERLDTDSLGLLFRYHSRILERTRDFSEEQLLGCLIKVTDQQQTAKTSVALADNVASLLVGLAESPTGTESRERFRSVLRIAGASVAAEILWQAVRGLRDTGLRARVALLTLLFGFNEDDGLRQLFRQAGSDAKYLAAFVALANRMRHEPTSKLQPALLQSYRTIDEKIRTGAFREFAASLLDRLRFTSQGVRLEVQPTLEQGRRPLDYRLLVRVLPDEADPPLSLSVEFVETGDFMCSEGQSALRQVTREAPLFEQQELEYLIRSKSLSMGSTVSLRVLGETASGQRIDATSRHNIEFTDDESFQPIDVDSLLDIYEGYDGKPVSGIAFVGRDAELAMLEKAVGGDRPGAIILYGIRRLGKTSLLDELRKRHCLTARKGSRTLFLSIPVDEFSITDHSQPFLDRFLRHIQTQVCEDPKNRPFHILMKDLGVSPEGLQRAAQLDLRFDGASFLMRLRAYTRRLMELTGGRSERVVFLFDEFDKLLEHYRKGFEGDVEDLTNQLRRAATEEENLGVVLAGSDLMETILGRYRNAMFGSASVLRLECFDKPEHRAYARAIIAPDALKGRRRFGDGPLSLLVSATGGHPLFMRLVACASVYLSNRKNISHGTVSTAIRKLLRNEVLQGYLPDVQQQVLQPLQVLTVLGSEDRTIGPLGAASSRSPDDP